MLKKGKGEEKIMEIHGSTMSADQGHGKAWYLTLGVYNKRVYMKDPFQKKC